MKDIDQNTCINTFSATGDITDLEKLKLHQYMMGQRDVGHDYFDKNEEIRANTLYCSLLKNVLVAESAVTVGTNPGKALLERADLLITYVYMYPRHVTVLD